jgi:hypothetical protein
LAADETDKLRQLTIALREQRALFVPAIIAATAHDGRRATGGLLKLLLPARAPRL